MTEVAAHMQAHQTLRVLRQEPCQRLSPFLRDDESGGGAALEGVEKGWGGEVDAASSIALSLYIRTQR